MIYSFVIPYLCKYSTKGMRIRHTAQLILQRHDGNLSVEQAYALSMIQHGWLNWRDIYKDTFKKWNRPFDVNDINNYLTIVHKNKLPPTNSMQIGLVGKSSSALHLFPRNLSLHTLIISKEHHQHYSYHILDQLHSKNFYHVYFFNPEKTPFKEVPDNCSYLNFDISYKNNKSLNIYHLVSQKDSFLALVLSLVENQFKSSLLNKIKFILEEHFNNNFSNPIPELTQYFLSFLQYENLKKDIDLNTILTQQEQTIFKEFLNQLTYHFINLFNSKLIIIDKNKDNTFSDYQHNYLIASSNKDIQYILSCIFRAGTFLHFYDKSLTNKKEDFHFYVFSNWVYNLNPQYHSQIRGINRALIFICSEQDNTDFHSEQPTLIYNCGNLLIDTAWFYQDKKIINIISNRYSMIKDYLQQDILYSSSGLDKEPCQELLFFSLGFIFPINIYKKQK